MVFDPLLCAWIQNLISIVKEVSNSHDCCEQSMLKIKMHIWTIMLISASSECSYCSRDGNLEITISHVSNWGQAHKFWGHSSNSIFLDQFLAKLK